VSARPVLQISYPSAVPAGRIAGLFAHPDDEVFCAGGTIAAAVEAGAEAMIVSATRGEAGQIRDASTASRATLGAVREQELRAACRHLGVQQVRCLDHIDGTLADLDRPQLVAELGGIIDGFAPDVVVTFGPDGAYGHPDHITVGEAVTAACLQRPSIRLYHSYFARTRMLLLERLSGWLAELRDRFTAPSDFARVFSLFALETTAVGYADDHINVGWYPPGVFIVEQGEAADTLFLILSGVVEVAQDTADGSRTVLRRQGPGEFFGELGVARHEARSANVIAIEAVTCLIFSRQASSLWAARGDGAEPVGAADEPAESGTGARPTTVIDVRSVVDRKVAALAAHRTQYPIEPDMFPAWLLEEMMGQEWFVRVQPAPQLETDLFA
jgi:LmbE family N-acetylglucosaminyl deacetylase